MEYGKLLLAHAQARTLGHRHRLALTTALGRSCSTPLKVLFHALGGVVHPELLRELARDLACQPRTLQNLFEGQSFS